VGSECFLLVALLRTRRTESVFLVLDDLLIHAQYGTCFRRS